MPVRRLLLLLFWALLIGPVVGFASHLFLASLEFVSLTRHNFPQWIWFLPILGLGMAWANKHLPSKLSWSVTHFIYELREPKTRANPFLSAWIFLLASLAHLGGGSVGREGVGLVMSGALVDGILPFEENSRERTILLQAALTAGFTGMFGTPLAAIFFIYEINDYREALSPSRWAVLLTAVFSTYAMGEWLETPHTIYPAYTGVSWLGMALIFVAIPLASFLFYYCFKFLRLGFKRIGFWQIALGGLVLSIVLSIFGTRYSGLGTPLINAAIMGNTLPWDWILKILFTTFTIAAGFKGGEVTPLFCIGATLGAWIGGFTGDVDLAKIGMVSILGGLTHTPISAGLLGAELFRNGAFFPSFCLTMWTHLLLRHRHLYRFD